MREAAAFAIAVTLFAIADVPIFLVFVFAWIVAWFVVAFAGALIRRTGVRIVLLFAALVSSAVIFSRRAEIAEAEALVGLTSVLADRFRLEGVAPRAVAPDRRQRFFTLDPALSFGDLEDWGHGLYAFTYDPQKHGLRGAPPPRPRPRFVCADPARGIAAVLSEETDEAYLVDRSAVLTTRSTADQPSGCVFLEGDLKAISRAEGQTAIAASSRGRVAIGYRDRIELGSERIAVDEAPDHLLFAGEVLYAAFRRAHTIVRFGESPTVLELGRPAVALAKTDDEKFLIVSVTGRDTGANHQIEDQLVIVDAGTLYAIETHALPGSPSSIVAASTSSLTVALIGIGVVRDPRYEVALTGVAAVADLGRGHRLAASPALGELAVIDPAGNARMIRLRNTELTGVEKGELAFYESTRSGVSCASCHLDADSDLSTHDIGHGRASPTLSVRGIAGTSPYLRGASYPTLDSLDVFAQTILGGYERELADRARLLAAFVRALPPIAPPLPVKDPRRGIDAFVKARCDRCHVFPAFTNLAQVPASYLFPELGRTDRLLDTPTLIGVSRTAPYLDDGRALTIESVLVEHNPNNRHGDVRALSPEERRALIELLEAL